MKRYVGLILILLAVLVIGYFIQAANQKQVSPASAQNLSVADDCKAVADQMQCWQQLLKQTLKQQGLPAAFDLLAQLYDTQPAFANGCHGFTHELGEAAYYIFDQGQPLALNGKTSYCGFGFYHGFMETLLSNGGQLQEARNFCAYVGKTLAAQTSNAENACYHGIGHGAVDGTDLAAWGNPQAMIAASLDTCQKVAQTEFFLNECASGAFNSLAIIYGDPKYKLPLEKADPFRICQQQPTVYKQPCYEEMNTAVMRLGNNHFDQAAQLLHTIKEPAYVAAATASLAGYAADFIPQDKMNNSEIIASCKRLPSNLLTPCVTGFAGGIIEFGSPESEYIHALNFCQAPSLTEELHKACFDRVLWLASVYYPADKLQMVCDKVEEKYRTHCSS